MPDSAHDGLDAGMALCRESENMISTPDISAKMLQDQTDTGTK
jgi:hypothetical protein